MTISHIVEECVEEREILLRKIRRCVGCIIYMKIFVIILSVACVIPKSNNPLKRDFRANNVWRMSCIIFLTS